MQKDGKSKNVRCVAVKIAAFSKKMQRLLFEGKGLLNDNHVRFACLVAFGQIINIYQKLKCSNTLTQIFGQLTILYLLRVIPDLTWQPEENDMTDECEEISKMAVNVDDENQPLQLKDQEMPLFMKSGDKSTSSNEQQNELPENQPLQLKDQEIHLITKSGDKGTSSNDQQKELPENQPLQLTDQEIHLITKSGDKGTSSNDQQKELPENQPLQLKDQEIHLITKSGDKGTSSNNQKKRKTAFDGLKDSSSSKEKVDGKGQRKPRSIDD